MTERTSAHCFIVALFSLVLTVSVVTAKPPESTEFPKELAFLHGTWRGKSEKGSDVEEYWSKQRGDSMIGHCRFIEDGKTTFYELLVIVKTPAGTVLRMKHLNKDFVGWKDSDEVGDCHLISSGPNEVTFENSDDAHKVQVSYRRSEKNKLFTVIKDTRDGKTSTYPFEFHLEDDNR